MAKGRAVIGSQRITQRDVLVNTASNLEISSILRLLMDALPLVGFAKMKMTHLVVRQPLLPLLQPAVPRVVLVKIPMVSCSNLTRATS
jgi:hypothetical protein